MWYCRLQRVCRAAAGPGQPDEAAREFLESINRKRGTYGPPGTQAPESQQPYTREMMGKELLGEEGYNKLEQIKRGERQRGERQGSSTHGWASQLHACMVEEERPVLHFRR